MRTEHRAAAAAVVNLLLPRTGNSGLKLYKAIVILKREKHFSLIVLLTFGIVYLQQSF